MERLIEFSSNHWILVSSFFAVLGLIFVSFFSIIFKKYGSVSPIQATTMMSHEDAVILDVREPNEFLDGHIINAIHIPVNKINSKLTQLEKHKNKPIIISCRSGNRSAQACNLLSKSGFELIYNLEGGLMAWQDAGLPVKKGKK